jgi:hypothetical protein
MHNVYIKTDIFIVSIPTRFDAFASSSDSLIFYMLKLQTQ